MQKLYISKKYDSPIGRIHVVSSSNGIKEIIVDAETLPRYEEGDPFGAIGQLKGYFDGSLKQFDLPLDIDVSDFMKKVLAEAYEIPYGKTSSYGNIANAIGKPKAFRAVGGALGRNPVPILIPCHRVVSKNSLRGFALGLEAKKMLLELESADVNFLL